jgi:hypothetical protein
MRELTAREGAWKVKGAEIETAPQNGVLVASVPLDRKKWTPLDEGATLLIEHGRVRCSA